MQTSKQKLHYQTKIQRKLVYKMNQSRSDQPKLNTFALTTNIFDKRKLLLSQEVCFQIGRVIEKCFSFSYGFLKKDKRNLLAST